MKLKEGFILHSTEKEHIAVAAGKAGETFRGMIRNNHTANFIFEMLLQETTEEEIVAAMLEKYDAPKEQIAADVKRMLIQIEEAGFLE